MAKSSKRVPIAHRASTQGTSFRMPAIRLNLGEVAAVILVLVLLVVLLMDPLRNYLEQRTEIGRLNASIAAKQVEKDRLINEIAEYNSAAYTEELARTRLGVIEEGEIAFRVVDPRLENSRKTTESELEEDLLDRPWYQVMWDSVTVEDALVPEETKQEQHHLPLAPTETPAEDTANPQETGEAPAEPANVPEEPAPAQPPAQ